MGVMQVCVERTRDLALIRSYIAHPRVYAHVSDDSSPPVEQFTPADPGVAIYALIRFEGEPVGVFMFVPEGSASVQVHTCLSPSAWGASAMAAKAAAMWLFETTDYVRINTQIPEYNRLAERLAVKSGMTQYGRCPKAFRKDGRLWDVLLYGMSKEA